MNKQTLFNNVLSLCLSGALFCACGDSTSSDSNNEGEEFKNTINALDWGTDTTFVVGHKTPDVDAVTSALSYAALMRAMGHNAVAKIAGPINRETAYIVEKFGFKIPEEMKSVEAGTRLILTDHAESAQSVEGVKEAKILQIIDHHIPGDIDEKVTSETYVNREILGSTCTIIWDLYKKADVKIDDEMAKILLAGLLSDTRNLYKVATTAKDTLAWKSLTEQLKLSPDSVAKLSREMDDASHDYYGMTDKEIFLSDYKDYEIEGVNIGIASNDWYVDSTKKDFFKRLADVMPEIAKEKKRDILFAKVDGHDPNPDPETAAETPFIESGSYTIVYATSGNETIAKEIAESAFGELFSEGVYFSAEKISRKSLMVPKITEYLEGKKK
jgi:manganese-dependent inorganic pyrophosphatase